MSTKSILNLTVNGKAYEKLAEVRMTLADFLRIELDLTGTHLGCEHGVCGACTVIMDGEAVRSCLLLAVQAEGATLETVEGLADGDRLHPLQAAFQDRHALQCGFCTPGVPHDRVRLPQGKPQAHGTRNPRSHLWQHLPVHRLPAHHRSHRPGGPGGRRLGHGLTAMAEPYIGAPIRRREDIRFITGAGTYVDDIKLPHMVHAAILRSPHAHARILNIDTKRAEALPGVVSVFTLKDIGELDATVPIRMYKIPGLDKYPPAVAGPGGGALRGRARGRCGSGKPLPGRGRAGRHRTSITRYSRK